MEKKERETKGEAAAQRKETASAIAFFAVEIARNEITA